MEGAKEEGMPVAQEIEPKTGEDPLEQARLRNTFNSTNPLSAPVYGEPEKPINPNSFIGKIAKKILGPLGVKPPQEKQKRETPPTPTESLP